MKTPGRTESSRTIATAALVAIYLPAPGSLRVPLSAPSIRETALLL